VIAALAALAMVAGNALVERLTKICGKRTTLLLWGAGVMALAFFGVGAVRSFYPAVILYLIGLGSIGVFQPVAQAYLHQIIPSQQRATVISFQSLASNGGSVVSQVGLGYLSQTISIPSGYVVGGLLSLLSLPVIFAIRRLGKPADQIVGTAGVYGACAAQGMPSVSSVAAIPIADATD
jgi:MFS family permease